MQIPFRTENRVFRYATIQDKACIVTRHKAVDSSIFTVFSCPNRLAR